MVAGMLTPSEGSIRYRLDGHAIDREKIFSHVAVTAPYIDLPEEFTLEENIRMQGKLKPYRAGWTLMLLQRLPDCQHTEKRNCVSFLQE